MLGCGSGSTCKPYLCGIRKALQIDPVSRDWVVMQEDTAQARTRDRGDEVTSRGSAARGAQSWRTRYRRYNQPILIIRVSEVLFRTCKVRTMHLSDF